MIKSTFLGLTLTALTLGGLTACATTTAQNPVAANSPAASPMSGMDHNKMNHDDTHHSGMEHGMDLGPADENYDLRFIDAMIPHHQGAIEMAKEAQQKSKRPEIKQLAQAILSAQDKEITEMKQWRSAWYPKAGDQPVAWHAEMNHMMPMSKEQVKSMMMTMDLGAADDQFDLRLLNAMIPHHEGAVVMAKDVLSKSKRPELQKLAQNVIKSQQAEIEQMKQWRKAWYNQ